MNTQRERHETSNGPGGSRGRWQGWPRWAGRLAVMVSIALLTAACGSSGTPAGSGASPSASSTYSKLVVWAQCIRSHGVPNFPDPNSNGTFPGNSVNLQSAAVQTAMKDCKGLQPNLGQSNQSQSANVSKALKYAQCMRAHGVPNFPDPSSNGQTKISVGSGINPQSPAFQKAQQDCQSLNPGQVSG